MLYTTVNILTLAQTEPEKVNRVEEYFSNFPERFTSDGLISTHWLLITAGAMLLLISALSFAKWWRHRHEHSRPMAVFIGAAKVAGLGWRDRLTLYRIARSRSLPSPLVLMLSPATFDHHVNAYLDAGRVFGKASLIRSVKRIRQNLYSDHPTHGSPPARAA